MEMDESLEEFPASLEVHGQCMDFSYTEHIEEFIYIHLMKNNHEGCGKAKKLN